MGTEIRTLEGKPIGKRSSMGVACYCPTCELMAHYDLTTAHCGPYETPKMEYCPACFQKFFVGCCSFTWYRDVTIHDLCQAEYVTEQGRLLSSVELNEFRDACPVWYLQNEQLWHNDFGTTPALPKVIKGRTAIGYLTNLHQQVFRYGHHS